MKQNFSPFGDDLFGQPIEQEKSPVAARFIVPPFSTLSARDGDWQERKRAWLRLGIKSECGRDEEMAYMAPSSAPSYWNEKMGDAWQSKDNGTSIFDPVLCELIYTWFSKEGQTVLDPFAGGSVRGIVASMLGRNYWGSELRSEQVEANRTQAENICKANAPTWICGDSMETIPNAGPDADLVFSCPPYGDLEVYSDDPKDLSQMEFHTFIPAYRMIIRRAVAKLKPDRFACFVVGDFRDSKGHYRNFVSETIRAFTEAGCELYNEAILLTSVGSAAMRVSKQFQSGRKFAKTHQNVLVFVKGDWKKATKQLND